MDQVQQTPWISLIPCGCTFREGDQTFSTWKNGRHMIDMNTALAKKLGGLKENCPGCSTAVQRLFLSEGALAVLQMVGQQIAGLGGELAYQWDENYLVLSCGHMEAESQLSARVDIAYQSAPGRVHVAALNTALGRWRLVGGYSLSCVSCDQTLSSVGRANGFSSHVRFLLEPLKQQQQKKSGQEVLQPPILPSAPPPPYNPAAQQPLLPYHQGYDQLYPGIDWSMKQNGTK